MCSSDDLLNELNDREQSEIVINEMLTERVREYQRRLDEASAKWDGVEICGVTKTIDVQTINTAYEAGIRTIGENRVQELMDKLPSLREDYKIHLIGQLQTNKVKFVMRHLDRIEMIQSLDRDSLAEELDRQAQKIGMRVNVLVQVNIAREPQKSGVYEEELMDFLKRLAGMKGIKVCGLMAIMPVAEDPEQVRPYFRRMREWFDRLRKQPIEGISMQTLSMGMSHDCIVAAEEGATMVRLGTALFGRRPAKG